MTGTVHIVEPEQIREWMDRGEVTLVDVREPAEYASEHIDGANLVPLSRFNPQAIPREEGKRIVVHCRSGSRCHLAAHFLASNGFPEIYRMRGGLMAWKNSGGPVNQAAGMAGNPADALRRMFGF